MRKLFIKPFYAMLLLLATSCVDDLTSLNVNPKAYQSGSIPEGPFFANATRNLTDAVTEGFNFKIWSQHFAETTYFTTSNYTLSDPGNGFWVTLYTQVLNDYKESKGILLDNPSLYAGVDKNKLAMIDIMEVYTYATLVNTFGDIPYSGAVNASLKSEALDPDNTTPAYDKAADIYDDLFVRLDKAIDDLDPDAVNGGVVGFGEADILFNDDVAGWVKFANSLKLRMAMTLADSNPTKAKSLVAGINPANLITSSADNASLEYLPITPNTNPIWVWLVQSGREDYVASNTMMDMMQAPAIDDPRIPLYYTKDKAGGYSGGKYGTSNAYVTFSKAGAIITDPEWPGILLDYVEVEFLLAEAAARTGFGVAGTAKEHYDKGVLASIAYWGGATADANAYLADPAVAFATALGSTDIERIARQKYIAMFNRGHEAWVDYRRLDYPVFNVPANPGGPFPIRYTYPNAEQTSNGTNYTAAAAAVGGDELTTRIFWDVK
jgi:Starch-binding associating with outer membrane